MILVLTQSAVECEHLWVQWVCVCAVSDYWCLSPVWAGADCEVVVPSVSAKNKRQLIHLQHIQQTQQSAVTANSPGLNRPLSEKLV